MSEAGMALLAAGSENRGLARAAARRYRHLMAGPMLQLLKGRSVREVARRAGLSNPMVSRCLRGRSDISLGNIPALAAALECTVEELVRYLLAVQASPLPTVR